MQIKLIRTITFHLHRILGLAVGIILVFTGLTGSILVFETEIDNWVDSQRFGRVTPVGQLLPVKRIVETVQNTYPDWQLLAIDFPGDDRRPFKIQIAPKRNPDDWHFAFANPFTGKIMGERSHATRFTGWAFDLHVSLMAGEWGRTIVGIASGLLVILSLTGVIL